MSAGCVLRLVEIGMPIDIALHARDIVRAYLESYGTRLLLGEWEHDK
jgi:hypothetical protein